MKPFRDRAEAAVHFMKKQIQFQPFETILTKYPLENRKNQIMELFLPRICLIPLK